MTRDQFQVWIESVLFANDMVHLRPERAYTGIGILPEAIREHDARAAELVAAATAAHDALAAHLRMRRG